MYIYFYISQNGYNIISGGLTGIFSHLYYSEQYCFANRANMILTAPPQKKQKTKKQKSHVHSLKDGVWY